VAVQLIVKCSGAGHFRFFYGHGYSYNGAPMEETADPSNGSENTDWGDAFLGLFEIIMVALSGSLLVQLCFNITNLTADRILENTFLLFIFMISEASISLMLICFLLRLRGQSFQRLGWIWKKADREILIGVAVVPILFGSTFAVGTFFQLVLPQYVTTINPVLDLLRGPQDLILFLISSIYVGGMKEEIQRAFVLDRFEYNLGPALHKSSSRLFYSESPVDKVNDRRVGITVGLILWSVFFAVGHVIQGIDNAVGAGVLGMLFGLLYIWRRNLVAPMLSHALYDITTLFAFWSFFA
jgi:uncharacterized protein